MNVEKYEIPDGSLQQIEDWIRGSKARGSFNAGDLKDMIEELAGRQGDPRLKRVAYRLADRLIQKFKKDGSIVRAEQQGTRPRWRWA